MSQEYAPRQQQPVLWNPIRIARQIWTYRHLIFQLTKRAVAERYRGSYLGMLWSFLNPLLMLAVYTFVFSVIFKARWDVANDSKAAFALLLFCGTTTFAVFSEVLVSSPQLILSNVNYVKKVLFPLEVLPVVSLIAALIHSVFGYLILILGSAFLLGVFHWTLIFLPLVLLPLVLLSMGLGWFLASLGVYLRDIGHIIGLAVQALMFLSPIFYPVSVIPKNLQFLFAINPISYVVEDVRNILIWGVLPNWEWLLIGTLFGGVVALMGHAWFQKTRGGFADVL